MGYLRVKSGSCFKCFIPYKIGIISKGTRGSVYSWQELFFYTYKSSVINEPFVIYTYVPKYDNGHRFAYIAYVSTYVILFGYI